MNANDTKGIMDGLRALSADELRAVAGGRRGNPNAALANAAKQAKAMHDAAKRAAAGRGCNKGGC